MLPYSKIMNNSYIPKGSPLISHIFHQHKHSSTPKLPRVQYHTCKNPHGPLPSTNIHPLFSYCWDSSLSQQQNKCQTDINIDFHRSKHKNINLQKSKYFNFKIFILDNQTTRLLFYFKYLSSCYLPLFMGELCVQECKIKSPHYTWVGCGGCGFTMGGGVFQRWAP